MKRCFLLALFSASAFAAGTVNQSTSQLGTTGNWVVAFQWTGDSSTGTVPVTGWSGSGQAGPTCCQGYLLGQVETVPGTPNPTNGYSVQIIDASGVDVLGGAASSLSSTVGQSFVVSAATTPLQGNLSLVITGQSVASAKGTVYVFLSKPGTVNLASVGGAGACPTCVTSPLSLVAGNPVLGSGSRVVHSVPVLPEVNGGVPWWDIRNNGAVCDGSTNVQSAVAAAITAGHTFLFLPANCIWIPTGNAIPGGLTIQGENIATSKIWPTSPSSNFLTIGPLSTVYNVNLNGELCNFPSTIGCSAYFYTNTDPFNAEDIQNKPYSNFWDVGDSPTGSTTPHDMNAIAVIERGQGGGIYGQYNGGIGASSGSGIQAFQASGDSLSAGLRSTKGGAGPGFVMDTVTGGSTGTDGQWTSNLKTSGNVWDFFHSTSTWSGVLFHANLGSTGGTFTGDFTQWAINNVSMHFVDYLGDEYHFGYEAMNVGASVTAATTITPTGPMFHVTGTTAIETINTPLAINVNGHCFRMIPDAAFTTVGGGNIAVTSTAIVGKVMEMCYDPGTSKYYPSY